MFSRRSHPGTHVPTKDIVKGLKISQSSVQRMIKRKGIKQFKRLKTPYMNDATQKRRVERAGCLLEKFETNSQMIEHAVFQDESDFPLQIPLNSQNDCVYVKGQKKDVPDKNLSHQTNRQSVKVMKGMQKVLKVMKMIQKLKEPMITIKVMTEN